MSHPNPSAAATTTREPNGKASRSFWFSCILYPLENEAHAEILEHVQETPALFTKYLWINHDRDVYTEDVDCADGTTHVKGELKKPHVHLMFRMNKQSTINGIIKYFAGDLSHVEIVDNEFGQAEYFIHAGYSAKKAGKVPYGIDELHGDRALISKLLKQNSHFVQLRDVFAKLNSTEYGSIAELIGYVSINCSEAEQDEFYEVLKSNQSIICTASNQMLKIKHIISHKGENVNENNSN